MTLPVKPYIKKYVETVEGSPIPYKGTSLLCKVVRAYLQNKNSTGLSEIQKKAALSLRTSSIEIVVPMNKMNIVGITLSDDGILHINAYLQDVFERAVCDFIKRYTGNKLGRYKGYKAGIEDFAKLYNIDLEEDLTYDGLQKLEYRFRKKEENFFSKIVLSLR
ncbi:MAG TPA: hypothetical protein VEB42_00945 [Chitinophagaceae bacterium]|nr:hypothetical protein [Chitinophagaceae bacterium]